jgi:ribose transport system substrate-binding protein
MSARRTWRTAVIALLACLGLTLAACSSAASSNSAPANSAPANDASSPSSGGANTVTLNLGGAQTFTWKLGQPLKVAFFAYGSSTAWEVAMDKSAKETAAKLGIDMTMFDPNEDAQTQFNQMQTALTSGKYNAWTFAPVDGSLICNVVQQAAAKGIAVINQQAGVCGRDGNSGEAARVPGLLGFDGGIGASASTWKAFTDYVSKDNPGPTKAIVLSGTAGVAQTISSSNAIKALQAARPDFDVLGTYPTDYSTQSGFNLTQQALQQHPNVQVIISIYSGITAGARQAVQEAGLAGKVKIYDVGGDSQAIAAVRSGLQTMTVPQFPATQVRTALETFVALNKGEVKGPVIKMNDGSTLGGANGQVFFVTKANAVKFTAEY